MPRKGYTSITVPDELIELLDIVVARLQKASHGRVRRSDAIWWLLGRVGKKK